MYRTKLELHYYSATNTLGFIREEIQDLILSQVALSEITGFYVQDPVTNRLVAAGHLPGQATSVPDLVRNGDNNLYWGYSLELSNGINIETDLNVTYIHAPTREQLFEYCAFIFVNCGQDPDECYQLIAANPDQNIALTDLMETEDPERPF